MQTIAGPAIIAPSGLSSSSEEHTAFRHQSMSGGSSSQTAFSLPSTVSQGVTATPASLAAVRLAMQTQPSPSTPLGPNTPAGLTALAYPASETEASAIDNRAVTPGAVLVPLSEALARIPLSFDTPKSDESAVVEADTDEIPTGLPGLTALFENLSQLAASAPEQIAASAPEQIAASAPEQIAASAPESYQVTQPQDPDVGTPLIEETSIATAAPVTSQSQTVTHGADPATPTPAPAPTPAPLTPRPEAKTSEPTAADDAPVASTLEPPTGKPIPTAVPTALTSGVAAPAQQGKASSVLPESSLPPDPTPTTPAASERPSSTVAPLASATQTSASAASARPAAPDTYIEQVSSRLINTFNGRTQRFEIRLDPPDLGRVEVSIEIGPDQRVRAVLATSDTASLLELMRGARALEAELGRAGIELADDKGLTFRLDRDGSESAEREGSDENPGADESAETATVNSDDDTPKDAPGDLTVLLRKRTDMRV